MVASVEEAYRSLMPDALRDAESTGTPFVRQGDLYAVATSIGTRELRTLGATFGKRVPVLGTNHEASEVAVAPDGRTFARGMLRHSPSGRPADHARRRMGDGKAWHRLYVNTVPRSFDVPRAFSASGMID